MLQTVLFYLISITAVVFALGVITARSAVYGVLCLIGAMGMVAGLFVLLKAYLAATVLLLVYAGAILVLFLFVVMLIDFRKLTLDWNPKKLPTFMSALLAVLLFTQFYQTIQSISTPPATPVHGTTEAVGMLLFTRYLLPFELTSFLLLAAVVSVVVLAKKEAS